MYGEPGLVVARTKTQNAPRARFLHGGSQKLPTEVKQPDISDDEVREALEEFGEPAMSGPVTLVLGGQKVVAPPRLFAAGLSMEAEDGELEPRVDGELVLEALRAGDAHDRSRTRRTPGFVVRKSKPRIVPAKVGVEIDPEEIERALRRRRRASREPSADSSCAARPPSPRSPPPTPGR